MQLVLRLIIGNWLQILILIIGSSLHVCIVGCGRSSLTSAVVTSSSTPSSSEGSCRLGEEDGDGLGE